MRTFLINPSRGLVIGIATANDLGHWKFTPFTSAHQGSRKWHSTKEAAALRYSGPSCRWIEATSTGEAHKAVNALKEAYDRNEPCSKCINDVGLVGMCALVADPITARNLGFCAKLTTWDDATRILDDAIGDPNGQGQPPLRFAKHE